MAAIISQFVTTEELNYTEFLQCPTPNDSNQP